MTEVVTDAMVPELCQKIRAAKVLGIDTESDGPQLLNKKMLNVYKSYLVGVSVAVTPSASAEPAPSYYLPVAHRVGTNLSYTKQLQVREALSETNAIQWAHNWKHDYRVLRQEGWLSSPPKRAADSMVAAWLTGEDATHRFGLKHLAKSHLGKDTKSFEEVFAGAGVGAVSPEEAAEYAGHDAEWTLGLGEKFLAKLKEQELTKWFWDTEMPFVFVLEEMERRGMLIDPARVGELETILRAKVEAITEEWDFLFPKVSITSGKQLQDFFIPGGHWNPELVGKTEGGDAKMDKEAMETFLANTEPGTLGHEGARLRLEYQASAKYLTTYTHTLVEDASQYPDRRLHPSFHQTGTVTGRLACSQPNLQNIPARSKVGKEIKACFVPAPGNVFVAADYSQIELRVLAHYSGGALAQAYEDGIDLHARNAEAVGCTRDGAKTIIFAKVYGAGVKKIAKQMGVKYGEAKKFIGRLDKEFPEVVEVLDKMVETARIRGYARTLSHRRRYLPGLRLEEAERWSAERMAKNTPIQGTASDVMKVAMLKVSARLSDPQFAGAFIVGQVHDELTVECPMTIATPVAKMLKEEMERAFPLKVPLLAEPKIGSNWAECK